MAKGKTGKASAKKTAPKSAKKDSLFTKTVTVYKDQKDYFKMNAKYMGYGLATRSIHAGCEPD